MKTTRILADAKVSYYEKVWANPSKVINLLDWLLTDEYKEKVEAVRAEQNEKKQKELRAQTLPQICAIGIATGQTCGTLLTPCGYMAVDVDAKENKDVPNFFETFPSYITDKKQCPDIAPCVTYCGLSSRGKGYVLFLPISEPSRWKDHYRAAVEVFRTYGIKVDPKISSNFRRFASYDPAPYINHNAEVFTLTRSKPIDTLTPKSGRKASSSAGSSYGLGAYSEKNKVEACIGEIERRGIDITGDSLQWFLLGCSLAGVFGEEGREFFHRVSKFYRNAAKGYYYTEKETNKTFTYCLKQSVHKDLRVFYARCARWGVYYKDLIGAKGRTNE